MSWAGLSDPMAAALAARGAGLRVVALDDRGRVVDSVAWARLVRWGRGSGDPVLVWWIGRAAVRGLRCEYRAGGVL